MRHNTWLHIFVLVLLGAFVLSGCGGSAEADAEVSEEVSEEIAAAVEADPDVAKMAEYANPDILVTAAQARQMLAERDDIVLLDIRRSADYLLGHIPGAIQIFRGDYGAAVGDEGPYPYGGMVAAREDVELLLGQLGVTPDTTIMAYDAKGDYDAARFWWILRMYGHDNYVMIDGGINTWREAGFDVDTIQTPDITPTNYSFERAEDRSMYATFDEVLAAIDDPNVVILDTRSEEEVTGETIKSGAFRAGHIPSSVWVEYKLAVDDLTRFRSVEELREMYASVGVTPDKEVIAFCQSGVRSAHTTFVLSQLLGFENVQNYDGSWIEWSYDDTLPIEDGFPAERFTLAN